MMNKSNAPLIIGANHKNPLNVRRFTGLDYRISATKVLKYDLPIQEQIEDPTPWQEKELREKCVRRFNKKYNMSLTPEDFMETKEESLAKEALPGTTTPFDNLMNIEDKAYLKDVTGIDVDKDIKKEAVQQPSKESIERRNFLSDRSQYLEAHPEEHKAIATKQKLKIKESTVKVNKLEQQHIQGKTSVQMDVIV